MLNLAGSAPAWAGAGQACVMHDAAVFDVHEAYARAFVHWYRWLFRHLARRDTTLLTVSAFSQGRLAQALGVPPARLSVLPLGADHLARTAPDTSILQAHGLADRPFLLAVGSANPNKGLARLARAWAALARDDARLVVAGGVDAKVFADAALPEVPGLVNVGPVGDAALRALYEAACGLVFPSRYEGFGLPPLEAMACGCPVAASQAASLPEACGDAALMLDPADDGAVLHAMRTLLDDAATRQRLRRAGLAWSARWRWDATADALLRALEPGR